MGTYLGFIRNTGRTILRRTLRREDASAKVERQGRAARKVVRLALADGDWGRLEAVSSACGLAEDAVAAFAQRMQDRDARTWAVVHATSVTGSIEHFHHYMGAVVYPVLEWIDLGVVAPGHALLFPDCGPMNHLMVTVADHIGFDIDFYPREIEAGMKLAAAVRHLHARPYDRSKLPDHVMKPHQLSRIRRVGLGLANIVDDGTPVSPDERSLLLIDRGPTDPWYNSARALAFHNKQTATSGSDRRSITNIDDLEATLAKHFDVKRVYLETLPFTEQIELFFQTSIVVAQHGAALNGLVWARPGATIIEIMPAGKIDNNLTAFANIADALSLRHEHVIQGFNHSPADTGLVLALARQGRDKT